MPLFAYKALRGGAITNGEIEANDRREALRKLDQQGLQPVKVTETGAGTDRKPEAARAAGAKASGERSPSVGSVAEKKIPEGPIKLKRSDVVLFTEELSDMLAAGLQLEPALRAMEGRQELGNLKIVSVKLRQIVRDGNSFSNALNRVSPSFGPLYCSLAAAGEASGALDTILQRQAHYLKTLQELQGRVTLALIYPAFLMFSGIMVSIIFVTKLIPQLTSLLESTPGAEMPVGAKILMVLSGFFSKWWPVLVLLVVATVVLFKAWKDAESNKPAWDRIKLRLPLFGQVVERRFFVQFLETMANLVGNGLPLLRALQLTKDATPNIHLRAHLEEMIEMVGDGRSLSKSMVRAKIFPSLLIDMVAVGEQTGKIDQALQRAAIRYDKELNNSLQRIMALIMPAVLIIMALLIGTMAYLMITAIFQTINSLSGR
ncbi:MAG TPA: type II secretory pathway protein [Verrucomicrobiales bacterium]|nr:type II secretory pathway protein [Deltaproteobacteria bacterium]HAT20121.1 type II secretory pathway protein [Verrucomicrobiales bacterium]